MAAKEVTLNEIGEMLGHVVAHMATKDDLQAFRTETEENFRTLRTEIAEIRRDLDDLREKVENVSGFRHEIDHALERIGKIEKHIGLPSHA
jgi:chromosome segregation ATPase